MTFVPRRFSLRTLLVAVAAISICLAGDRAYQAWYVRNYPGYHVSDVVHVRVRNGDAFQEVLRHFDSSRAIDQGDSEWATVMRVWQANGWPIQPGDEFFHFSIVQHGAWFQFRQGRVVNHRHGGQDLDQLARMNHYRAPPVWLRHGIWPFYVLVAGLVVVALGISRIRRRFRSSLTPV